MLPGSHSYDVIVGRCRRRRGQSPRACSSISKSVSDDIIKADGRQECVYLDLALVLWGGRMWCV